MKVMKFGANRELGIAGEFELNGEVFTIRQLPSGRLAHLVASVNNGEGDGGKLVGRVFDFMEVALIPEDVKRFERVLLDPVTGLETEEIMEVFTAVVELVAEGKAGGPSSDSSPSPKRTGTSSTGTRRGAASTR